MAIFFFYSGSEGGWRSQTQEGAQIPTPPLYLGLMFSALSQDWVAASEPTQHFPRRVDHGVVLEGQWGWGAISK